MNTYGGLVNTNTKLQKTEVRLKVCSMFINLNSQNIFVLFIIVWVLCSTYSPCICRKGTIHFCMLLHAVFYPYGWETCTFPIIQRCVCKHKITKKNRIAYVTNVYHQYIFGVNKFGYTYRVLTCQVFFFCVNARSPMSEVTVWKFTLRDTFYLMLVYFDVLHLTL
jgi:hypothetical protein